MDQHQANQSIDSSAQNFPAPTSQGPEEQGAPAIDPAYVQTLEQRAAMAEQQAIQTQQALTQISVMEANRAYEARKAKALQEAQEKEDPNLIAQFYENESRQKDAQVQTALASAVVNSYRQDLQQRYGLREDQMDFLGENPHVMERRAAALAQQNAAQAQFQQTVDTAFIGQQAHERVMSNADRIGGMRGGQGRPEPTYDKGSREHLADLLFGEGQTFIP